MAATDTIYCQKSSSTETDWEKIYEVAFRPDQRTPLNQLQAGLASGQMLLHRSSTNVGLLCFSVTNILPTVALLAYLATDPNKRSSGIGSKHMKSLITQVKNDNPQLLGMFAEIESTREKGISEDEKKHRRRRLQFYQRLGFKRYKGVYTIPSYDPSVPDEEGELIWLEFNAGTIDAAKMAEIIKEIYVKAYLLKDDDSHVTGVPVLQGEVVACAIPDEAAAPADTSVTATAPAAATTDGSGQASTCETVSTDPQNVSTTVAPTPEPAPAAPATKPENGST